MPSPLSAWLDVAERENVLVAALQGLKGSDNRTGWHDCRSDADNNPQTDDVAFASRVAKKLVDDGRADAKRIYVMGMSNGAMMTLRLALEMQPAPAAVAAVAGTMAAKSECAGSPRPVSVLLIHGTQDPLVPYIGGGVGFGERRDRGSVVSVAATRDFWLRADDLQSAKPVEAFFPARRRRRDTRAQSHLRPGSRPASRRDHDRWRRPRRAEQTLSLPGALRSHRGRTEPGLRGRRGNLVFLQDEVESVTFARLTAFR